MSSLLRSSMLCMGFRPRRKAGSRQVSTRHAKCAQMACPNHAMMMQDVQMGSRVVTSPQTCDWSAQRACRQWHARRVLLVMPGVGIENEALQTHVLGTPAPLTASARQANLARASAAPAWPQLATWGRCGRGEPFRPSRIVLQPGQFQCTFMNNETSDMCCVGRQPATLRCAGAELARAIRPHGATAMTRSTF